MQKSKQNKEIKELQEKASKNNLNLVSYPIRHLGTEKSHVLYGKIENYLKKHKINMLFETEVKDLIIKNGYICMSQSENRLSFNKGYTENGFAERIFHLHLRYAGDNNELYFRDYLIEFPDVAKEYEELKLSLWKKYEHNRDDYTNAKTEFVKKYTEQAKLIYGNRY